MAENTRVCVSGYVLGSLIFHHFNNDSDVEGFILGEIKAEEKNDITDSQMEHVQFEHTIDIAKHVTCYKLNSFYGYLGELKEEEIKKILSRHKKDNVVGWYRQRRNTDHRMTFRDQIIHRNLQRAFSNYELVFLLLTTSEMSSRGSTYRLEYSIFKAHGSQFHKIPVLVTNLGMLLQQDYCRTSVSCSSAGYKRAINKHRSRFFASDGSLKEVNDVNEMNSSLQEELKQTCARVEESERAMEKLLTEVAQLRKAVAERRRVQSKSEEQDLSVRSPQEENMYLCRALKASFPDSEMKWTPALTLKGIPILAYCCRTDREMGISAKLPVLLGDGDTAAKTKGQSKKVRASSPGQTPPPRKRPFAELSRVTRSMKGSCQERQRYAVLTLSEPDTEDDGLDSQNGDTEYSRSPTF
ncbi:BRCA1-A complex subunit Abraxas 1 isoform X1 [Lepisosteus oculatus]|uniref:BRCA1-A complex subunit Abraxas 1 isoform X1 n=1 Tax=Lepisosteus oculatus TaxID=7918 RepID=UPI003716430A